MEGGVRVVSVEGLCYGGCHGLFVSECFFFVLDVGSLGFFAFWWWCVCVR